MSSTNGSGRPSGYVSIPVEIIRDSNTTGSGSHSRHNSPYRTVYNDSPYAGRSNSPSWTPTSTSRFQPRQSPTPGYDRVITNSQFNQPLNDFPSFQQYPEPQFRQPQQRMYEPGPLHFSRSSEDLLSSPFDAQPQYASMIPPLSSNGLRIDSDFVQPNRHSSPLRRSFDALNDFGDMRQSFPATRPYPSEQPRQPQQQQQQDPYYRSTYQTQHRPAFSQQQQPTYVNQTYTNPNIVYTDEYGAPTDPNQTNSYQGARGNVASDRSRSPSAPRGASPARPPSQQQQDEPELKMAKDTDGPIPMPAPMSSSPSSAQSTDQPVPSPNTSAPPTGSTAASSSPTPPQPPEVARDPNAIALEKLEQMKQSLTALERSVDDFVGSTRNDRAYKLLDEQALKIMMRCDELIDVSPDIKEKRKEIICNVQRVIGKLESKVPSTPAVENNSNPLEVALNTNPHEENTQHNSVPSSNLPEENASATEQSIST